MNIDETKIVEKLGGELFLIDEEGCLTLTDGRLRLKGDFTSLMRYLFEDEHALAALLKDALRRAADIP